MSLTRRRQFNVHTDLDDAMPDGASRTASYDLGRADCPCCAEATNFDVLTVRSLNWLRYRRLVLCHIHNNINGTGRIKVYGGLLVVHQEHELWHYIVSEITC